MKFDMIAFSLMSYPSKPHRKLVTRSIRYLYFKELGSFDPLKVACDSHMFHVALLPRWYAEPWAYPTMVRRLVLGFMVFRSIITYDIDGVVHVAEGDIID
jgi:hypothetical protein